MIMVSCAAFPIGNTRQSTSRAVYVERNHNLRMMWSQAFFAHKAGTTTVLFCLAKSRTSIHTHIRVWSERFAPKVEATGQAGERANKNVATNCRTRRQLSTAPTEKERANERTKLRTCENASIARETTTATSRPREERGMPSPLLNSAASW